MYGTSTRKYAQPHPRPPAARSNVVAVASTTDVIIPTPLIHAAKRSPHEPKCRARHTDLYKTLVFAGSFSMSPA